MDKNIQTSGKNIIKKNTQNMKEKYRKNLEENGGIIENSLSIVWKYIENDEKTCGIVSAYRANLKEEENDNRYNQLKQAVRNSGYVYIEIRGGYKEKERGFIRVKALFVLRIKKNGIINLGKKYEQDSVLYKDDKAIIMFGINKSTGEDKILLGLKKTADKNNIDLAKELINKFFSELLIGSHKEKKFVFNLQEKKQFNHIERYAFEPFWFDIIDESVKIRDVKYE